MCRPSINDCTRSELNDLQDQLHVVDRDTLIFAAGVAGNKWLANELGSQELSRFYEGMRAADPGFENPYWPKG